MAAMTDIHGGFGLAAMVNIADTVGFSTIICYNGTAKQPVWWDFDSPMDNHHRQRLYVTDFSCEKLAIGLTLSQAYLAVKNIHLMLVYHVKYRCWEFTCYRVTFKAE
ncbi:unnamed protein product [Vicia faba]|uniref:Uncharacterized protein n=1 Tax=Vicia faba TaxID=3906 RepID=A0AAV1A6W9_VICFA|nr:unnamed protein product [Vicia faba]